MLTLEMKSTEAYDAKDSVVHLAQDELDFLSRAIGLSARRRTRICAHRSVQERLHEMFVIYSNATFVRPNKHLGKDESVFVIRGEADFIFFDDQGNVTEVVRMGDQTTGKAYYCRVPQGVYHTITIHSDEIVLFEATPGPFNPAETVYADWGPQETDTARVAAYVEWLGEQVRQRIQPDERKLIGLEKLNDLVLVATDTVVPLSRVENRFLQEQRRSRQLDRLRICVHKTPEDRLHEMLMIFAGTTYIRPSLHVDKEESLFILDGLGTYVFFDYTGVVTSAVRLGPLGSGRSYYCRIPANTYHSLVVESDEMLVKETTSGPFRRSDTIFASWSPDGSNAEDVKTYLASLRATIEGLG